MSKKQVRSRKAKRDRFVEPKKEKPRSIAVPLIVAAAVLVIGGGIYAVWPRGDSTLAAEVTSVEVADASAGKADGSSVAALKPAPVAATNGHDPYPELVADNGTIRLPLSTFEDGEAHYYTYMNGDSPIEFFVLKSNDGIVRAAFNACDVCFHAQAGYSKDGDEMVCNNCGLHFPSNKINEIKGGCNPSPLQRTVEGDMLVLLADHIVGGAEYF